jgi:hypothetical protein
MKVYKGTQYDLIEDGHFSLVFDDSWPRGILSPDDRDYLVLEDKRAQRGKDERRHQIRQRLRAGLVDISLIWTSIMQSGGFDYSDLETVFDPPDRSPEEAALTGAIQDQTAMTYIGSKFLKRPYQAVDQLGVEKAEYARRHFEEGVSEEKLDESFPEVSVDIQDKVGAGWRMESKEDYLDRLVEEGGIDEETIEQWLEDRKEAR